MNSSFASAYSYFLSMSADQLEKEHRDMFLIRLNPLFHGLWAWQTGMEGEGCLNVIRYPVNSFNRCWDQTAHTTSGTFFGTTLRLSGFEPVSHI